MNARYRHVAYGLDDAQCRYWVAVWGDDGPETPEVYCVDLIQAEWLARAFAVALDLENIVQVDALGPIRAERIAP